MSFKQKPHPDESQLLLAIVDETKLPDSIRKHLSVCPRCRADIKMIEQDLNNLSQKARQLAPVMHRKISLPVEKSSIIYRWMHDWRISFGAVAATAAATAMVLIVVWLSLPSSIPDEDSLDIISQISWRDDNFMAEISALAENVLPQVYLDIIEESYLGTDDEFIKSVVPSTETDSLSYYQERKGVKPC
ncbi:MAG: hypothetical protein SWH54_15670 [Thermodesulfobacteriota bacterium]|nr:hypothetical protein [Thermodesulfobacteriota bacterium]